MKDINVVLLVGRITRDSETRQASNGNAVAKFSIAINGYKDSVSFVDCVMFGKMAESVSQYLKKGKQVCVEGEIKQNRWERDGAKHSKLEIVVNQIQLLGGKTDKPDPGDREQVDRKFEDDIPF